MKITDRQLKKVIRESLEKVLKEDDNNRVYVSVGEGGGYYGGSPIFSYDSNTGEYCFRPSGWNFDTTCQIEAAAILSGSIDMEFINNEEYHKIRKDSMDHDDLIEATYWLSGGNRIWRFHDTDMEIKPWNECREDVAMYFRPLIDEIYKNSIDFYDLVDGLHDQREEFTDIFYENEGGWIVEDDDELEYHLKEDIEEAIANGVMSGEYDKEIEEGIGKGESYQEVAKDICNIYKESDEYEKYLDERGIWEEYYGIDMERYGIVDSIAKIVEKKMYGNDPAQTKMFENKKTKK